MPPGSPLNNNRWMVTSTFYYEHFSDAMFRVWAETAEPIVVPWQLQVVLAVGSLVLSIVHFRTLPPVHLLLPRGICH
jgi:hypothetical protein